MGSLYRPTLKSGKLGAIYWAQYYVGGRPIRESTRTADKATALLVLKRQEGAAASGRLIPPYVERIEYDELTDLPSPGGRELVTYFLLNPDTGCLKIGRSFDVRARRRALEHAGGRALALLGTVPGDCEREWHARLDRHRTHGEWFRLTAEGAAMLRSAYGWRLRVRPARVGPHPPEPAVHTETPP